MFIPFLMLLTPMIGGLWSTHVIFDHVYERERSQIAMDNAAIILGETDRETLNWLETKNRQMRPLEQAHHVFHACARVPKTQAACLSKDLLIETRIKSLRVEVTLQLVQRWHASQIKAVVELQRLKAAPFKITRSDWAPIRERQCPVCAGTVRWEPVAPSFRYIVRTSNPIWLETVGVLRNENQNPAKKWEYQLQDSKADIGFDPHRTRIDA